MSLCVCVCVFMLTCMCAYACPCLYILIGGEMPWSFVTYLQFSPSVKQMLWWTHTHCFPVDPFRQKSCHLGSLECPNITWATCHCSHIHSHAHALGIWLCSYMCGSSCYSLAVSPVSWVVISRLIFTLPAVIIVCNILSDLLIWISPYGEIVI